METGVGQHFVEAQKLLDEIKSSEVKNAQELEQFRIAYLGTKGRLKDIFGLMKEVPAEERKNFGQTLNTLKQEAESKYESLRQQLRSRPY